MRGALAAASMLLAGIAQYGDAQLVVAPGIDPQTLQAAVAVACPYQDYELLFQAHQGSPQPGAPWQDLTTVTFGGTNCMYQLNLGDVPRNGITFRAMTPGPPAVIAIDESYIPYPSVDTLSLVLNSMTNAPPKMRFGITVLGNAYSNPVSCSVMASPAIAYFRLTSTNGCPTNATLQYSTDLQAGGWTTTMKQE
ncbi:MAG: hypothetical protein K8T26_08745 [Lentisphaerae bacterium]|nr:hypothetical protein [Lentisphaerota bacterium]